MLRALKLMCFHISIANPSYPILPSTSQSALFLSRHLSLSLSPLFHLLFISPATSLSCSLSILPPLSLASNFESSWSRRELILNFAKLIKMLCSLFYCSQVRFNDSFQLNRKVILPPPLTRPLLESFAYSWINKLTKFLYHNVWWVRNKLSFIIFSGLLFSFTISLREFLHFFCMLCSWATMS